MFLLAVIRIMLFVCVRGYCNHHVFSVIMTIEVTKSHLSSNFRFCTRAMVGFFDKQTGDLCLV